MTTEYRGKRIDIVQDSKGYFYVIWHTDKVPMSPPWTWRTEQAALADAKRFIERTYGKEQ